MSEEPNDDFAALALGALSPPERAAALAKLRQTPADQELFADYAAVARGLAKAVPAAQPPDSLRAAILQRAAASIPKAIPQRGGLLGWLVRRLPGAGGRAMRRVMKRPMPLATVIEMTVADQHSAAWTMSDRR